MSEKLDQVYEQQKQQFAGLLVSKEELENKLQAAKDAIEQLKGSLAALEYVKTLGLVEPPDVATDVVPRPNKPTLVPKPE